MGRRGYVSGGLDGTAMLHGGVADIGQRGAAAMLAPSPRGDQRVLEQWFKLSTNSHARR
jgi:hypothetical protein